MNSAFQKHYEEKLVKELQLNQSQKFNADSDINNSVDNLNKTPIIQQHRELNQQHLANREEKRIAPEDFNGNLDLAKLHCLAAKVGYPKDGNQDICPCCFRKIDEELDLNFNIDEISFLGVGYPQFYTFMHYCLYIIFAIIISSSSYNALSNTLLGTDCIPDEMFDAKYLQTNDVCQLSWTTQFSLANKRNLTVVMQMQQVLNFSTIITLIILLFKARLKFKSISRADSALPPSCPSSYAVFMENIPQKLEGLCGKSIEKLIASRIKEVFGITPIAINICWNLADLRAIEESQDCLISHYQNMIKNIREDQLQKVGEYIKLLRVAKEQKYQLVPYI